LTNQKLFIQ